MTVAELIAELSMWPPETVVVVGDDGNPRDPVPYEVDYGVDYGEVWL